MSSFTKQIGSFQVSHEYTQLEVVKAKVTEKEKVTNGQLVKTKTFKEVAKAKTDILTVRLTTSDLGQQLTFCFQRGGNEEDAKDPVSRILATFTMTKDFKLSMVCNQEFNAISSYTFKPLLTAFPGIEAGSISDVFSQWLCTDEFFEHLKIVSSKKGYTPGLVKMLVLYISYQDVKDEMGTKLGQLSEDMVIDVNEVAKVFRANMQELQMKIPKMAEHYKPDLLLSPATNPTPKTEENSIPVVEVITPEIEENNLENSPETVDILATSEQNPEKPETDLLE